MLQIDYMLQMGVWCSGNTMDSKPIDVGSIPTSPAKMDV